MKRKDCGKLSSHERHGRLAGILRSAGVVGVLLLATTSAHAGSIHVWPSAVVVDDQIRVTDVCELRGLPADVETRLASVVVAESPPQGGTRLVHVDAIRQALSQARANLAQITVHGAVECQVSRPAKLSQTTQQSSNGSSTAPAKPTENEGPTLKQAIIDFCTGELARYGGTAEVVFDRTDEQILELSGSSYRFEISRRGSQVVGFVPLEVSVFTNGKRLQVVPITVDVTMRRRVVVARRTINQDATITDADVELVPLRFRRVDEPGLRETAQAVGQRAKRVIPAGTYLEPDLLEEVPLVLRGQLVTLTSTSGPVRVVTTAKAMAEGLFEDVIRVRSVDDKHTEMDAIVTGPGEVRIGGSSRGSGESKLAKVDQ